MSDFERSAPPPASGAAVFLQVALGIATVLGMHVVVGGVLWVGGVASSAIGGPIGDALTVLWVGWLASLGVSQLLYVVPVALAAFFVRRPIALGMVIAAALTFVLQGACYGLFLLALADAGKL